MFKYLVALAVLAFAASRLAAAADQPRSFNDLTAKDPPANTFHGPPSLPPGLGGTFPLVAVFLQPTKTIVTGKTAMIKIRTTAIPIASP
jgi:hypothetical protein